MIYRAAEPEREMPLLQTTLLKRIERVANLRALLVLHAALYGVTLTAVLLTGVPHAAALIMAAWLPLVLLHAVAHTLYELRERCAVQPQPAPIFHPAAYAVELYDEHGNVIPHQREFDALPPPR